MTPAPPLSHVRVVDLTDLRGALAGRILADLGADVVKAEPPGGDPGRLVPPFAADVAAADRSLPFLFRNLGKRGAVIDFDETGWDRFRRLCEHADVLIENLDAQDAWRQRLEPELVRARHPHLIHVTMRDFGRSGPRAAWRLEPLPAFASSGALWASGFPESPPCWLPGFQAHDCASVVAVVGALGTLLGGTRHGGGTIEVAVQEAAMASLAPWGVVQPDYAERFPLIPRSLPRDADGPAVVLPVADGWIRVLAVTPRQLRALAALLTGREPEPPPEPKPHRDEHADDVWHALAAAMTTLVQDGVAVANRVAAALSRLPVRTDVLPALEATLTGIRLLGERALAHRRRDDVVEHARRLGLPIAPVNPPEEFVVSAQTKARHYFRRTGFPHLGAAPVAPFPCNMSATPVVLARPAPAPGEDTGAFAPRDAPQVAAAAGGGLPLAGIRVVSLGVGAVIPELCTMLRDLGAEVVKIESAASPDFLRRLTIDFSSPNRSFMFNDENRGQESVCIDLSTERGRELARRLCAAADVVAENRQGGLVERLGLGYDTIRRLRPDVVYVSSQGFGRGGPLGEAPAYGPLAAAFAGTTWLWNHPNAPYPGGSSLEHPDHLAGKLLAIAVLAALEHRRRTGEGQYVELAQSEAAAFFSGDVYLQEACTGRPALQRGNTSDAACPHGVYPSRGDDRWIAIAVAGDDAWARFRRVLSWADESRFTTLDGRLAARAELDARVAAWTSTHTAEEAAARLQAAGVSACPVQGPDDHRADAHLAARGALVRLEDPEIGPVLHVANPLRMTPTPLRAPAPAPALGADTERVLVRVLGMTVDDVQGLIAHGVCR